MQKLLIINGPNLNLLGKREPGIYGNTSFEAHYIKMQSAFPNINFSYFQSNHEGSIIDKLHESGFETDGIIINAGAYTHTSIAIADAIKAIDAPCVEVHISNVYERETFRHHSYLKDVCIHTIVGKGLAGYDEAVIFLREYLT